MLNLETYEVANGVGSVNSTPAATNSCNTTYSTPVNDYRYRRISFILLIFVFGAVSLVWESSYLKQINNIS